MDIPDGDLVRLARDGDQAAFRLLVERHLPVARTRAARLCPRTGRYRLSGGCQIAGHHYHVAGQD